MELTCWWKLSCESRVTPRLLSVGETGMIAPATLTVGGLSVCLVADGVPRRMASDLLGLRQRPLSRNQRQTAAVHGVRLRVSPGTSWSSGM